MLLPFLFRFTGGRALITLGILFFLFGILVAVHPEILVALVSFIFIFLGFTLFSIGLGMYQKSKRAAGMFFEDKGQWGGR